MKWTIDVWNDLTNKANSKRTVKISIDTGLRSLSVCGVWICFFYSVFLPLNHQSLCPCIYSGDNVKRENAKHMLMKLIKNLRFTNATFMRMHQVMILFIQATINYLAFQLYWILRR